MNLYMFSFFFFFSSRSRHTRLQGDWSSDVCSSDLALAASQFDAVYCSHNLEHYYRHDGATVLRGFLHVLKPDGFAEIKVPDAALRSEQPGHRRRALPVGPWTDHRA